MKEQLEQIRRNALAALDAADTPAALEELRVKLLGKKGEYYLKARQSTNELQSVVQGKESGIAQARDALSQAQEEYQTAQQQEGEFSRQLEALEASDTLENAVQRQQELRALASQQQQDVESEKTRKPRSRRP